MAEAGIGKSRLLYEFEVWSEARPESFFLFRGRATPATGKQAFGLLRDIIAWRLQINDDDRLDETHVHNAVPAVCSATSARPAGARSTR